MYSQGCWIFGTVGLMEKVCACACMCKHMRVCALCITFLSVWWHPCILSPFVRYLLLPHCLSTGSPPETVASINCHSLTVRNCRATQCSARHWYVTGSHNLRSRRWCSWCATIKKSALEDVGMELRWKGLAREAGRHQLELVMWVVRVWLLEVNHRLHSYGTQPTELMTQTSP